MGLQTGGIEWFATSLEFLDDLDFMWALEIAERDAVDGLWELANLRGCADRWVIGVASGLGGR